MKENKYTIDMLTENSVSVLTQRFMTIEGRELEISNTRKAYVNTDEGREDLKELPENIQTAILKV